MLRGGRVWQQRRARIWRSARASECRTVCDVYTQERSLPHRHVTRVAMFAPQPSSALQQFTGWLIGRRPEFVDARFVAQSQSREVTRVTTSGYCTVAFNVMSKDMKRLGY